MFLQIYVIWLLAFNVLAIVCLQEIGDSCDIRASGNQGVCTLLSKCDEVYQAIRKGKRDHTVCGYQGRIQIVCCPQAVQARPTAAASSPSGPQTISVQKCNEYQQAVYEKVQILTLFGGDPVEQNVSKCAVDSVPLIVGGTEARQGEFPHMALLGYQSASHVEWACGGTLISDEYVLTAAHCMLSRDFGEPRYIKLGAHNLDRNVDEVDHTLEIDIAERIPHPEYRSSSQYNDIALVRLQRKITLTPYIRPACLPTTAIPTVTKATATGWGSIQYQGATSSTLLKVVLELFTNAECNETFNINRRLKNGIVEQTQLCAGSHTEEKDTCQGDSGGPLQIDHPTNYCMFTIIGVTSFGKACGLINSPGVYTRVFAFLTWIEGKVWPSQ